MDVCEWANTNTPHYKWDVHNDLFGRRCQMSYKWTTSHAHKATVMRIKHTNRRFLVFKLIFHCFHHYFISFWFVACFLRSCVQEPHHLPIWFYDYFIPVLMIQKKRISKNGFMGNESCKHFASLSRFNQVGSFRMLSVPWNSHVCAHTNKSASFFD